MVSFAPASAPRHRRIALTGGIASGKTTVAQLLARRGALVLDYDQLSRDVVAPGGTGLSRVAAEFGPEVLNEDGSLNRAALAEVVFSDAQGRQRLEAILHPLVTARADELEAQAPADQLVIHDVPLLVEAGLADRFDVIIVTDLDPHEQVKRAQLRDGSSAQQVSRRMAAQASRAERLAVADHVIDTSGALEELDAKVDRLWAELVK